MDWYTYVAWQNLERELRNRRLERSARHALPIGAGGGMTSTFWGTLALGLARLGGLATAAALRMAPPCERRRVRDCALRLLSAGGRLEGSAQATEH